MGRSKGNTLGQPAPSVQVCCFRTRSYPFAIFCVTERVLLLMFSCFFFSFQKRRSVWLTVKLHGPIRCAMWTNVYLFLINNSGQQLRNWLLFLFDSPSVHFLGLVLRIGVLTEKRDSYRSLKVNLVPAGIVHFWSFLITTITTHPWPKALYHIETHLEDLCEKCETHFWWNL